MKFGIEQLLSDSKMISGLKGKRLALVAHPASVDKNLNHSLDLLLQHKDLNICCAFGPQHGMKGEKQDNMVESEDYLDPTYGIPIFSLYGEVRRPTTTMMEKFDVVLFDLQDVGTRIYTFLTTLLYMMQACTDHKKKIIVLDRPNPAGREIEGSLLLPGWESFVGAGPLPMRHGLTMGEAAFWFRNHYNLNVDLEVIKLLAYSPNATPGFGWPSDSHAWVNPSPNAPNLNMTRCFPGTVMIEGTNLSEGRGTTRSLEVIGAPDIDFKQVLFEMHKEAPHWLKGALYRHCYFQPTFHKHAGQLCQGIHIHTDYNEYDPTHFKPYRAIALTFKKIRQLYPEYPIWRDFHYEYEKDRLAIDLINGGPFLREWVDSPNASCFDFDTFVKPQEEQWRKDARKFHLY